MKTSRLIAVGAVGVAALWTAGWFAGRSLYVEPEAQRVVDKLRAGDIFFTYERRTIGGFPVAYDVAYEGVSLSSASTLWRWSLPRLSVGSGLVDSGVVTLRPASESKLIIESAALSGQDGAEPVVFDIRVDAPLITLTGDDEQAAVMLRASGLSAKQTAGDAPLSDARIQLDELALDARLAGAGKDGKLTATALEIAYTFSPDMVSETSTTINVADLAIGFTGEALDAADFAEFVSRDGAARATIATGRYEIASAGSGGPSQPPYELEFGAGSSETIASIREGRARYEIDSTELLYAMERDPPAGGATVDAFSMMLDMPIRRGAAPYQLTLSVDGVKPDDAFWSVTDATGSLPRTPMALNLEFAGTARILADLGGQSFNQPPIDVETLEIRAFRAEGMGLLAEATGALDIAGDASMPDGDLSLDLTGALALIGDLAEASLIPEEVARVYTGVALEYGRKGEGEDHLLADIHVSNGAMTINGRPLQ
ncbi:DUF2125 domain-containing protein [Pikeienuella piscinae]|uniref:DUF2125 domain-containing protein n=1 Tax=Pikeienuella piscinae TaxID=2748098 RepID=A0A7M3T5S7_9RHOB|nr:DUF2125 domain-containing protein [Pikeienuella piscinae]QIE57358.1 DUF2125 domain-containing protein [Pikeienuella piscinae]